MTDADKDLFSEHYNQNLDFDKMFEEWHFVFHVDNDQEVIDIMDNTDIILTLINQEELMSQNHELVSNFITDLIDNNFYYSPEMQQLNLDTIVGYNIEDHAPEFDQIR